MPRSKSSKKNRSQSQKKRTIVPDPLQTELLLAQSSYDIGDHKEAMQTFQKIIDTKSDANRTTAELENIKAAAYIGLGKINPSDEQALSHLQKAYEIYSTELNQSQKDEINSYFAKLYFSSIPTNITINEKEIKHYKKIFNQARAHYKKLSTSYPSENKRPLQLLATAKKQLIKTCESKPKDQNKFNAAKHLVESDSMKDVLKGLNLLDELKGSTQKTNASELLAKHSAKRDKLKQYLVQTLRPAIQSYKQERKPFSGLFSLRGLRNFFTNIRLARNPTFTTAMRTLVSSLSQLDNQRATLNDTILQTIENNLTNLSTIDPKAASSGPYGKQISAISGNFKQTLNTIAEQASVPQNRSSTHAKVTRTTRTKEKRQQQQSASTKTKATRAKKATTKTNTVTPTSRITTFSKVSSSSRSAQGANGKRDRQTPKRNGLHAQITSQHRAIKNYSH